MSRWWLTRLCTAVLAVALGSGVAVAQAGTPTRPKSSPKTTKQATSSKKKKSAKRGSRKTARRARGQQAIDPARATEIQQALIREKYLDGDPTGAWDQRTKDAMARYQADHGWQTKVLPDSRALIKLGLGPNHSNLINPDTAAIHAGAISTGDRQ